MWSPLKVAQPSASSERSPVPTTKPPIWLAMSIKICVRSRACEFSKVTLYSFGSCPISRKCCCTASTIGILRKGMPSKPARCSALLRVRAVVPKPGIVTVTIPARSRPRISKARMITSSPSVESSPPERPNVTFLEPVCLSRRANPVD